jgi:predicted DCC family thiol-disulfide oxidoreductase YuxK
MKTNNKTIIYDDTCPMCTWYTGVFVKTGLIEPEGRKAFSNIEPQILATIDLQRGKNEIPLVDMATGQVHYGIDAMLEVLGQKLPWVKTIGNCKPIKWFLYRLYRLVTYNRRVIVAPAAHPNAFDCTPDFNRRYRIYFMVLCLAVNTLLLFPLHQYIFGNIAFTHLGINRLLLGHTALVVLNILLLAALPNKTGLEYLGQVNMLATLFFLLCLPLLFVNKYLVTTGVITNMVYLGALGGFIAREYVRRMQFAGIWPRYKWVIVADLGAIAFFFTLLFL